jgi:hypothetical protein
MSIAAQQIAWIEVLLKGTVGLLLCILPVTTARLIGLPIAASGFWPRLLGAVLVGIATALFIEGRGGGPRGLGMAGVMIINLAAVAMLVTLLILDRAASTMRGRLVLWVTAMTLLLLAAVELVNT